MANKRSAASGTGLERSCTESHTDWMRSIDAANGVELLEAWFHGQAYHPHRHDTYAIGLTEIGVQHLPIEALPKSAPRQGRGTPPR